MTAEADLARIVRLADFEAIARERMDAAAYDYVVGGAWDELSLAENTAAWSRWRLRPRVLVDVATVDLATTFLGIPAAMPVATAPMAAHGLAHPDAEVASAAAAAEAGVPFTLSTMSSRSIEEVAAAAPSGVRFFQLYHQRNPRQSRALCERAAAAGYRAIVLTVDLPVLGYRERDRRNGFDLTVPLGNFAPQELGTSPASREAASGYDILESQGNSLTWRDLAEIRRWTNLPVVLKGILTAEDARLAAGEGVDGIIVSNHGARQLDRVASGPDALEPIVAAVGGQLEVWVDGGIRRGLDVAVALALGARGVLVGRPILWALAAGGQAGVARALAILREETEIAFKLLGIARPSEATAAHVERPR